MSATKALVAYHHATYGGVYYSADINFANSAVQPTWARYATTGLANLLVKVMQNDPVQPYDKVYIQLDNDDVYIWNGSSWTKVMDTATASTLTGRTLTEYGYVAQDKAIAGHIYIPTWGAIGQKPIILKSTDYGASWTTELLTALPGSFAGGDYAISAYAGYVWLCASNIYRSLFYYDGAAWKGDYNIWGNTGSGQQVNIDPTDPTSCYYTQAATDPDLVKYYYAGSYANTVCQDGLSLGSCFDSNSLAPGAGCQWLSPTTNGKQRILRREGTTNLKMYQTADLWANLVEGSPTSWHGTCTIVAAGGECAAQAAAIENDAYVVMGFGSAGDANESRVYAWVATGNTATSLPWQIAGTNHATGPYTNAIPSAADAYTAVYGVFVGEAPAEKGVYVFADEQGDITNLPTYTGLGTPLFGSNASFRDRPADGLDIYHAEDVHRSEPQIHAPWPATDGQAPVSDGSKYVAVDIATQAELDAHAALEIPAVHTGEWDAHKVLIGPTSGAAATPTIREATLANGDITDVDITGAGTGDIIYKSAGDWIDYPLGVGVNVSNGGGKFKIGDLSGGDYVSIDTVTGNVILVGNATAWDDLRVSASIAKPGATAPGYKAFGPSGSLQALMFEAGHHDEVFFEIQMPHNWLQGSNIYPHVHWTPTTADAGNVVWELEYAWANIGGTFGAPGNMASDATAAGGTAWVHKLSALKESGNSYIDGTGKTLSSMLVCRLHRNSNSGSDTLNKDVALLEFDLHYQIDGFGSDTEYIKDESANSGLLLETGDHLLLETGDNLLLE